MGVYQNNNHNTLYPPVRFHYLTWTFTFSSYSPHRILNFLSFLCACGLFRRTQAFACVLMQVKFRSHLLEPHLSAAFTIWSHLLQQCFDVYLHCEWLPGALFPPLCTYYIRSLLCSRMQFFRNVPLVYLTIIYLFLVFLLVFLAVSSCFKLFYYLPPFPPASELKMNGWGHRELSTLWSYGCYRLCSQLRMRFQWQLCVS